MSREERTDLADYGLPAVCSDVKGAGGRGYVADVRSALSAAVLFFAAVVPTVQVAVFAGDPESLRSPAVLIAAGGVHLLLWTLAVFRKLPVTAVLAGWALIGAACALQAASGVGHAIVAPLTVSASLSAGAALALPRVRALVVGFTMSIVVAGIQLLVLPPVPPEVWIYPVLLPVYSLGPAVAISVIVHELYAVARRADENAPPTADSARSRSELVAKASRRRTRILHDTIVNTLAAIATARTGTSEELLGRRCAEDARNAQRLRRGELPDAETVDTIFERAAELGVELDGVNVDALRGRLGADAGWRRREIIATLREVVTNIGKHARVSHAQLAYRPDTFTVTVSDRGVGTSPAEQLRRRLSMRGEACHAEIRLRTQTGRGTEVTMRIAPLTVSASGLFEAASRRMVTGVAAVMLTEFAIVNLVVLTFVVGWSPTTATPQVVGWLVLAVVLLLVVRHTGRAMTLPVGVILLSYYSIGVLAVVAGLADTTTSICGRPPTLLWIGDAVATVCAVLILADGRLKVIAPAVVVVSVGAAAALGTNATRCGGTTAAGLVTGLLLVAALVVLRSRTLRLSGVTSAAIEDELSRRELEERLAVEEALRNDGFASTLTAAGDILADVAMNPARAADAGLRAAATREEGYLRALMNLGAEGATAEVIVPFTEAIDDARCARIALTANAEPGVLDGHTAQEVARTVRRVIALSDPGDEVSRGVFGPSSSPTVIVMAAPSAVRAYSLNNTEDQPGTDVLIIADLGLIEMRWADGPNRSSRRPHPGP